jgi:hypothetical protein
VKLVQHQAGGSDSNDVIACGTDHARLGALQDGKHVGIEIAGVATMALHVVDPLKCKRERGVHMGEDPTHPGAARRHRPRTACAERGRKEGRLRWHSRRWN